MGSYLGARSAPKKQKKKESLVKPKVAKIKTDRITLGVQVTSRFCSLFSVHGSILRKR